MRIVLDTNVLVSAILNPRGKPADILNLVLDGRVVVCYDDRIFIEYRGVLLRERFRFHPDDVESLLLFIAHAGERIVPVPRALVLPDPDDLMFYEVLSASSAKFLVTGNVKHFLAANDRRVVSPQKFLEKYFLG